MVIRRIDDLGRIVIPKEIRRALRIFENCPLEISMCGNTISLVKHDNSISQEIFDLIRIIHDEYLSTNILKIEEILKECAEKIEAIELEEE